MACTTVYVKLGVLLQGDGLELFGELGGGIVNMMHDQLAGKVVPHWMFGIVDRLKMMYGSRLEIVSMDGGWLTFRVLGFVEATLLVELQKRAAELFGAQVNEYQATAMCNGRKREGVSIRYVGFNQVNEADYSGFWFY